MSLTNEELMEIVKFQHNLLEDIYEHSKTWVRNYSAYRSEVKKSVEKRKKVGIIVSYEERDRVLDLSKMKVPNPKEGKKISPKAQSLDVDEVKHEYL